jgi:hypothetical protein
VFVDTYLLFVVLVYCVVLLLCVLYICFAGTAFAGSSFSGVRGRMFFVVGPKNDTPPKGGGRVEGAEDDPGTEEKFGAAGLLMIEKTKMKLGV